MELEQLDVKTTFLHGRLEGDILLHETAGFEGQGRKKIVCRLKGSLYELKQLMCKICYARIRANVPYTIVGKCTLHNSNSGLESSDIESKGLVVFLIS